MENLRFAAKKNFFPLVLASTYQNLLVLFLNIINGLHDCFSCTVNSIPVLSQELKKK
jgi:hypothetical protein